MGSTHLKSAWQALDHVRYLQSHEALPIPSNIRPQT